MLKPPAPYHLRPMRLSDIISVMRIEQKAFPVPWKASAYEYEVTANRLATYQVLTINYGDQPASVIGYAGSWLIAGETHVSTIAVDPKWRRRGLGELLLLNLLWEAYAQRAFMVTLEVRRSNLTAQALYRKYRFVEVGERPRYYQDKEDALLMTVEALDKSYKSFLKQCQESLFRRLEQERPVTLKQ
jgi:ribosomal-protein-alanine N-acetyltransferase